ncbi:MAG TPA: flagellar biosynthetic protein FliR [Pirellulaceae bacterium]|nr:flagellar biosynthetic protein FliR [Pirellulaceae bacterium]
MPSLLANHLPQFLVFLLVLTRVGALVATLPVLSSAGIPIQVRALLAVAMAALIAPLHWGASLAAPLNVVELAVLLGREALLGLALGAAITILLSGMQLAGQIISQMSGQSLADVFSPTTETQTPIFSHLLELLALAIFFSLGGHRHVMDALLGSFAWMPPGSGRLPDQLPEVLAAVAGHSFETGIRASAPVVVALLLAVLIVALIGRTLPQLHAIAIGLNFNALVALAVLACCLSSAALVFQDEAARAVELVREAFGESANQPPLAGG